MNHLELLFGIPSRILCGVPFVIPEGFPSGFLVDYSPRDWNFFRGFSINFFRKFTITSFQNF